MADTPFTGNLNDSFDATIPMFGTPRPNADPTAHLWESARKAAEEAERAPYDAGKKDRASIALER